VDNFTEVYRKEIVSSVLYSIPILPCRARIGIGKEVCLDGGIIISGE